MPHLAVPMRGGGVHLRHVGMPFFVMMRRFEMMMRCRVVVRSRLVVMRGRRMHFRVCHNEFPVYVIIEPNAQDAHLGVAFAVTAFIASLSRLHAPSLVG